MGKKIQAERRDRTVIYNSSKNSSKKLRKINYGEKYKFTHLLLLNLNRIKNINIDKKSQIT